MTGDGTSEQLRARVRVTHRALGAGVGAGAGDSGAVGGRFRRWALAAGAATAVALLAGGCGIRPTAIPVDAGAPASRTSCPTPLRPPAAASPSVGVQHAPAKGVTPSPLPSATPSLPDGSLFSALPSPSPSPSGTLHCDDE
ncbi:hypothetical protein [Kitasatospora viridis]|uniref:Uncharacterized protein n=1 Tax=Kitasatospora viridis TaxID=281105 RepID=A0A561UJR8_9ACTN|nr:hypothetical protein [Kitasatospora viridis]TWF99611.1 hypothetical protein FHX73_113458 [Kitasatospora viridis]